MRNCPVCEEGARSKIFAMSYRIPDGWPLPTAITWFECFHCGMLYGDGDFNQAMLNEYYLKYYGYGVNSPANIERLKMDAVTISGLAKHEREAVIVDFGGNGDDGRGILVDMLHERGYVNAVCVGAGEAPP